MATPPPHPHPTSVRTLHSALLSPRRFIPRPFWVLCASRGDVLSLSQSTTDSHSELPTPGASTNVVLQDSAGVALVRSLFLLLPPSPTSLLPTWSPCQYGLQRRFSACLLAMAFPPPPRPLGYAERGREDGAAPSPPTPWWWVRRAASVVAVELMLREDQIIVCLSASPNGVW